MPGNGLRQVQYHPNRRQQAIFSPNSDADGTAEAYRWLLTTSHAVIMHELY